MTGPLAGLVIVVLTALVLRWVLGARCGKAFEPAFDPAVIGDDLDAYLSRREARFDDILPGVAKQVIWFGEKGRKSRVSVVYIHGFSATLQEVRPLPDQVASTLGANLFLTRLAGHGRGSAAMAEPTVSDWMNDVAEALEIGRRLGDEVIVMATSTGATLATVAAANPRLARAVKAMIFISPNFGLADKGAALLNFPLARFWVPWLIGRERGYVASNEEHARYWTTRYPVSALFPMARLVHCAVWLDHSTIAVPLFVALSEDDDVVRPEMSRKIARRWGGGATIHLVTTGPEDDPSAHVIAGDILSPHLTGPIRDRILTWLSELEPEAPQLHPGKGVPPAPPQ